MKKLFSLMTLSIFATQPVFSTDLRTFADDEKWEAVDARIVTPLSDPNFERIDPSFVFLPVEREGLSTIVEADEVIAPLTRLSIAGRGLSTIVEADEKEEEAARKAAIKFNTLFVPTRRLYKSSKRKN